MGRLLQRLPVLCVVAIVPFISRTRFLKVSDELLPYSKFKSTEIDIFTWWKSRILMVCGLFALISVIQFIKNNKIPESSKNILGGLLGIASFIICSSLFSKHPYTAWFGLSDYNEGALTLLAYVSFMASGYLFFQTEKTQKQILIASTLSVCVVFMVALFQGLEGNFLMLPFFRAIVSSDPNFEFYSFYRPLFSTLLNSNHLGTFAALCFPLMVAYTMTSQWKDKWFGVLLVFMTIYLAVGSESRGAWIAIAFVSAVYLILFRKKIYKYWPVALVALLGVLYLSNSFSKVLLPKLAATWVDITDVMKGTTTQKTNIQHLSVKDGQVRLVANNKGLVLRADQTGYHFEGIDGRGLPYFFDAGKVNILDPGYSLFKIELNNTKPSYMKLSIGDSVFEFIPTPIGLKAWSWGTAFDTPNVNRVRWPMPNASLSGRSYIWSVTLPLLMDTLFIGKGPATFTQYFPQMDLFGKASAGWRPNIIIDRPHNLFLQMIHATGFLSFLIFIYLLSEFFVPTYRILFDPNVEWNQRGFCLLGFFGVGVAFLVNGMFNDSMVGTSPLFWVCFGTGLGLVHEPGKVLLKDVPKGSKKIKKLVSLPA